MLLAKSQPKIERRTFAGLELRVAWRARVPYDEMGCGMRLTADTELRMMAGKNGSKIEPPGSGLTMDTPD
jgi:hypothetical protein